MFCQFIGGSGVFYSDSYKSKSPDCYRQGVPVTLSADCYHEGNMQRLVGGLKSVAVESCVHTTAYAFQLHSQDGHMEGMNTSDSVVRANA